MNKPNDDEMLKNLAKAFGGGAWHINPETGESETIQEPPTGPDTKAKNGWHRIVGGKLSWVRWENVKAFLAKAGVTLSKGVRHNRTDGEAHYHATAQDGSKFECHANFYSSESWIPLVRWAAKQQGRD